VGAAYSAMQAGGVVAGNPAIAPVGDEILRSAGWQDKAPEQQTEQPAPQQPQPMVEGQAQPPQLGEPMNGPQEGMQQAMQQGIETERMDG